MGNLRYVTLGPERLRDTVEDCDFVTVRHMNEVLERVAKAVEKAATDEGALPISAGRIRALKEKV